MATKEENGVAIIGSSNMDLVHSVDHLPKEGETIFANSYQEHLGGKGNNQANMIARLTTTSSKEHPKCIFLTGVGNDGFAQTLHNSFAKHLHNCETIITFDDTTTGRAIINVDQHGRNNIVLLKGANAKLQPDHVDRFWPLISQNCKVLVLQNEIPFETTAYALKRGRDSGLLTVFNPAPAPEKDLSVDVLNCVDILCLNETEAISMLQSNEYENKHELTVEDGKKIAQTLYEKYANQSSECSKNLQILITMGGNGSIAYYRPDFSLANKEQVSDNERVVQHFPVQKVEKVVDTTGAGDAFVGSLCYFLSCNVSLKDSIPLAASVASRTVSFHGAQSSYEAVNRSEIHF